VRRGGARQRKPWSTCLPRGTAAGGKAWQSVGLRGSERAEDERTVKWRTVDGKLLLDPGKKGVYSSYTHDFLTQAMSAVELNPPEYTMWVENTQRGDDACNDLHAQPGPVLTRPGEAVRSVLVQIQRD